MDAAIEARLECPSAVIVPYIYTECRSINFFINESIILRLLRHQKTLNALVRATNQPATVEFCHSQVCKFYTRRRFSPHSLSIDNLSVWAHEPYVHVQLYIYLCINCILYMFLCLHLALHVNGRSDFIEMMQRNSVGLILKRVKSLTDQ